MGRASACEAKDTRHGRCVCLWCRRSRGPFTDGRVEGEGAAWVGAGSTAAKDTRFSGVA